MFAPIASADVNTNTYPVYAFDYPVDKIGCELKLFTRIPAGSEGGSHKCPPIALLRHDDFSQDRFVELDKIASVIS